MLSLDDMFKANQDLWNKRTQIHKNSSFYNLRGFISGGEVLTSIELSELLPVKGKTLLHLQCHFGMDTLAWARHGALVTGIDFSSESINEAKQLAADIQIPAEFYCGNVYDTSHLLGEKQFDIIYTSYGAIGWLPDLTKWAAVISRHLKPGGIFYIAEFHPVVWMFDDEFSEIKYPYDNVDVIITETNETYADRERFIDGKEYGWNHSLSEVLNSLINNNLQIQQVNEYSYSPYPSFKNMVAVGEGKWHIKGLEGKIPLVYTVKAVKK